jgi:hypothetical protein
LPVNGGAAADQFFWIKLAVHGYTRN